MQFLVDILCGQTGQSVQALVEKVFSTENVNVLAQPLSLEEKIVLQQDQPPQNALVFLQNALVR